AYPRECCRSFGLRAPICVSSPGFNGVQYLNLLLGIPGYTIYSCATRPGRRRLEVTLNRSVCPWFFATPDAFCNLGLKSRWTESKPVFFHLIDQQPLLFRTELHQPVQRLFSWDGLRPRPPR